MNVDKGCMNEKNVSVNGSVSARKDKSDMIREAVMSLLIHKFPETLSSEEIKKFVIQCQEAQIVTTSVLFPPKER